MSSLTKLLSVFSVFLISACSFSPVYNQASNEFSGKLAAVTVADVKHAADQGRYAQSLKAQLEDLFNPTAAATEQRYTLHVTLGRTRTSQLVQNDREVTRYQLIATGEYSLIDNQTNESIGDGSTRVIGSYDAVTSDFATYAAEEDTMRRLTRELSEAMRGRVTHLLN